MNFYRINYESLCKLNTKYENRRLIINQSIQELFNSYIDNLELEPLLTRLNTNRYIGFPYEGMVEWAYDTPQGPNGHPLELGHKRIADKIAEYI